MDDLASSGKFVPESEVKRYADDLVYQCRRSNCFINFRDITVLSKYSMTHGRISELIKIFCWMSPITSLHELERALLSSENIARFEDLRMGPLIKHPLVLKFFQPPTDLQSIPEISAHQIQKTLMKFLDKFRHKPGQKQSLEEFLEFFSRQTSVQSPHHLCIRITSFPLAIQVATCECECEGVCVYVCVSESPVYPYHQLPPRHPGTVAVCEGVGVCTCV